LLSMEGRERKRKRKRTRKRKRKERKTRGRLKKGGTRDEGKERKEGEGCPSTRARGDVGSCARVHAGTD